MPPHHADHGQVVSITHNLFFRIVVGTAPAAPILATAPHRGSVHSQAEPGGVLKGLVSLGAVQHVKEGLPRGCRIGTLA